MMKPKDHLAALREGVEQKYALQQTQAVQNCEGNVHQSEHTCLLSLQAPVR